MIGNPKIPEYIIVKEKENCNTISYTKGGIFYVTKMFITTKPRSILENERGKLAH